MKNKKLIARISAVAFALILVFALAIPCFADEIDSLPTDFIYKRFYNYDDLRSSFDSDFSFNSCIIYEGVEYNSFFISDATPVPNEDVVVFSINSLYGSSVINMTIRVGSDIELPINVDVYTYENGQLVDHLVYDCDWTDIEIYILKPSPADNFIEEQGWYGQIKNIIKDAVFGSDTVLNDSQEFTINQISLWLSLIAILLPLIVVAIIVVRCFR